MSPITQMLPAITAVAVLGVIVAGWLQRGEEYLVPESGPGYWLGIGGSMAMLSLLVYSLRKRYRAARIIGSVRFWFRTHMLLGIAGPVLVLFHTNFKLGPMNSNVALFAMLLVACSGIVGKYIYGKIHMGLYGHKARVEEILAQADELKRELGEELKAAEFVSRELNAFSNEIKGKTPTTAIGSLWFGAIIAVRARALRHHLIAEARRLIRIEGKARGWSWWQRRQGLRKITQIVRLYSAAVIKAAELGFYERLFALWHVLHLPLFFLMVGTGIIHVWAVHHY
ncbi:pyridine nucleotide-disulfide oxidoreductase [Bradyrhizobium sp. BR13661]|uniref:pyridine nucleotide-disulfide oxidoreductase n=2 Tax=Pseudomonadota TaxID=1224 RepID=UPI0024771845|nr:pyridine nucleotide-disulfide oxidoreductase [Bradyrhizobium sp. BR13661]